MSALLPVYIPAHTQLTCFRIAYINKLDKPAADVTMTTLSMTKRLQVTTHCSFEGKYIGKVCFCDYVNLL